jgi:DNA-binding SARP family transcriptional activator
VKRSWSGSARNRIRAYRIAAGLTQRQLARTAGVSIGVVRDLEQGRTTRLRTGSADALIRAFGLDDGQAREFASTVLGRTAVSSTAAGIGQSAGLRLSVLGPLTAWLDGAPALLGSPLQRAVLALLALSPDRLVHREALIDALWGADPPASAVNQVQTYVSRIRWMLDPDRPRREPQRLLESTGTGYRLRVTAEHLDLLAFQDVVTRAEAARSLRDTTAACGLYQRALQLWRGDPLADVDRLRCHPAVIGLRRQWSDVIVAYAEAACDTRLYSRVLPYLRRLTLNEPLHERAHALLMIALAGSGRQAAALEVFEDVRRQLDEELGVRPCAQLADAHQRVLQQQVAAGRMAIPEGAPVIRPIQGVRTEPIVPRQLPPPTSHFVGRANELTALAELMDRAVRKEIAAVFAIGGTVGVGKSALGLHWAHLVADRFPDGQLHVNLRGFAPSDAPVTPAEALCGFFDALQVPNGHIPASIEGQASLYRSVLAGKRMLVVLDNAGGSEQVRPLLPGRPGCLVLVTSRSRLTGLVAVDGAQSVMLDELDENEARELLERRLGLDRVAAEPDAASDIVRLCARLPMALSIVAARAAVRPCLRLAALASELGDRRTRLDALDTEEAAISLRAAFSWSFDQLNTSTARMFRLLGARSAADISVPAAASLAGMPMHLARAALDQLACVGLLSERVDGQYTFHELLRDYAAEQAAAPPRTRLR